MSTSAPTPVTTVSEDQQKINELLVRTDNLKKDVKQMIETLSKSPVLNLLEIQRLRNDYILLLAEEVRMRTAKTPIFIKFAENKLLDVVLAIEQYLKILKSKHYQATTTTTVGTTSEKYDTDHCIITTHQTLSTSD